MGLFQYKMPQLTISNITDMTAEVARQRKTEMSNDRCDPCFIHLPRLSANSPPSPRCCFVDCSSVCSSRQWPIMTACCLLGRTDRAQCQLVIIRLHSFKPDMDDITIFQIHGNLGQILQMGKVLWDQLHHHRIAHITSSDNGGNNEVDKGCSELCNSRYCHQHCQHTDPMLVKGTGC